MRDRAIALAGMFQALKLVQQMANTGQSESEPLNTCIDSLFRFDADSAQEVYGDLKNINPGLRCLLEQLDGSRRDAGLVRMGITVLQLERRFVRNKRAVNAIQKALEDIARQREHFGPTHPTVLARLGELYAEQISPLGTRVLVQGNPVYLAQANVVGEVRATLLAALRAAVLWRQVGGSYWDLIFSRGVITRATQDLISGKNR